MKQKKKREIKAKGHDTRLRELSDLLKMNNIRGAWVAQSVKHLTSTLVMISQFMDGFQPSVSLCTDSSEPGA